MDENVVFVSNLTTYVCICVCVCVYVNKDHMKCISVHPMIKIDLNSIIISNCDAK